MSEQDVELTPTEASEACVLATLMRMLTSKAPHAWELFNEGVGWFARAKEVFVARGFAVGQDGMSILSPQGTVVSEMPAQFLSKLAAASRRSRNACALAQHVPAPDSNVITHLLLATGVRPHLTDQLVATAAALRCNDQSHLRDVAGEDVCALCRRTIGPHHPLLCAGVATHGMAHDKLVNQLAVHAARNSSISVRSNQGLFKASTRQVNVKFRPDIAIEETNQLFEVKTANSDAHGSSTASVLAGYAREARSKYWREVKRVPLVIATTTDGFVSREGFMALEALTNSAYLDMPDAGPRLTLIAGFALCEAAAGAYDAWHWTVRSMQRGEHGLMDGVGGASEAA